ncbi:peptide ABC transporter permease [Bacillus pseudomycoides]|uniref:ABC transporter permease subunit n=1 Tax=Bacillus pseudomycoides TaxID=64104 RepID=A0AAJ1Z1E1_9BACI|nr:ABC transporter permease subunit [Bacillus pseudomycoides]EEM06788.1 ABC transporter, permease protein [Bacillus pseudomycoides]EEM12565.1 ABC transporter, permease protein [Bacillus pseudomycoides]MDR4327076.1 ABC transporter permease subunit [Bacillus pseudomycoides]MED1537720.1 ABC transporter permease subunit [Bacillus pseudomycoides]MED1624006.1 ABC transporter permease subunit [Bacillus pseudomycoides]
MWKYIKRDKKFWFSILFLVVLVGLSIGNTVWNGGHIRQVSLQYDAQGNVEAPPFSPSSKFLLGTDRKGYDLLHLVIEGAKWTIGISAFIAMMRVVLGVFFGVILGTYVKRGFSKIEAFFDSFTVIPTVMIAYFFLQFATSFVNGEETTSFFERASFQVILLVVLAVPTISLYVANEVRKLQKEEFIDAARILGGSRRRIVVKHLFPHLYMTFVLVLMQQFIQTLIIFLHLGLLEVFFGGTVSFGRTEVDSYTHEWSGLIGVYFRSLSVHPWIPLVPITFFGLTIFSGNMIVRSIEDAIAKVRLGEMNKDEEVEEVKSISLPKEELFTFKHTM